MARRGVMGANLPLAVARWIDDATSGDPERQRRAGLDPPLSIASRDEFVRVAVAVFVMSLRHAGQARPPLEVVQELARAIQQGPPPNRSEVR